MTANILQDGGLTPKPVYLLGVRHLTGNRLRNIQLCITSIQCGRASALCDGDLQKWSSPCLRREVFPQVAKYTPFLPRCSSEKSGPVNGDGAVPQVPCRRCKTSEQVRLTKRWSRFGTNDTPKKHHHRSRSEKPQKFGHPSIHQASKSCTHLVFQHGGAL